MLFFLNLINDDNVNTSRQILDVFDTQYRWYDLIYSPTGRVFLFFVLIVFSLIRMKTKLPTPLERDLSLFGIEPGDDESYFRQPPIQLDMAAIRSVDESFELSNLKEFIETLFISTHPKRSNVDRIEIREYQVSERQLSFQVFVQGMYVEHKEPGKDEFYQTQELWTIVKSIPTTPHTQWVLQNKTVKRFFIA